MSVTIKRCDTCNQPKTLSEYWGSTRSFDGRTDTCKSCTHIKQATEVQEEMVANTSDTPIEEVSAFIPTTPTDKDVVPVERTVGTYTPRGGHVPSVDQTMENTLYLVVGMLTLGRPTSEVLSTIKSELGC